MKSFAEGTHELEALVGDGVLEGRTVSDLSYSAAQHEGGWKTGPLAGVKIKNHPKGGGSHFLSGPIQEKWQRYYDSLAEGVLKGEVTARMVEIQEDLVGEIARRAPVEHGTLRASGQPFVFSDGKLVYHRPAGG